ncbi:lateral signaling target protein 2 homolog [Eleutherodactylus coqui]|uniref:lateral signaling target protein 2 homolog n=1 Tax=Eleutherodactylus coqui TaxID=57060 RepID=UPI003462E54D
MRHNQNQRNHLQVHQNRYHHRQRNHNPQQEHHQAPPRYHLRQRQQQHHYPQRDHQLDYHHRQQGYHQNHQQLYHYHRENNTQWDHYLHQRHHHFHHQHRNHHHKQRHNRQPRLKKVESRPEIWDPAEPGYSDRDLKVDAWIAVCSGMYPNWDSATAALQSEIFKDIKNRWRSVRERFKKHEKDCEKSGMSPSKKKCPHQDILHFLRTSRALRPSSRNITAAPPTVETASANTEGLEQESRDDEPREGTPTLEDSQRSTPDLYPTSVTPEVGEQNVSRSSSTAPGSRAGSSREVSSERTSHSVAACPRRNNNKTDAAQEALALLRRADTEDQWDTMGATIASCIRELNSEHQWAIAPVLYAVLEVFASQRPIADSCAITLAMKNAAFAVSPSNRMLPPPQSFPDQPGRVSRTTGYPMHHVSQDTGYGDTVSGRSPSPSQSSFL